MDRTNSLLDFLCYVLIFSNFYTISNIPLADKFLVIVHFFQFLLFLLFFSIKFRINDFFNYKIPEINFINFFFILLFLSFIWSSFFQNFNFNGNIFALTKLISYPILIFIFFFYFSDRLVKNDSVFLFFLKVIIIFGCIDGVSAVFFKTTGIHQNIVFPEYSLGFFGHPNTHSFLYTFLFPALLYFNKINKLKPILFYGILVLFSYNMLYTYSRAGFIGLIVAFLIMTSFRSIKWFFITFISLSVVSSLVYFLFIASTKVDSSFARLLLIVAAVQMITESTFHMLWGYGVYNAIEVFKMEKNFVGSLELVVDPHNWFLLMSIQFGLVVSFLTLIIFLLIIFKSRINFKRYAGMNKIKFMFAFTVSIAMFVQNLFEDIIVYPEFYIMPIFLSLMGMLYILSYIYKNPVQK